MGWFSRIFASRTPQGRKNITKITDLTPEERAEIEDQTMRGVPARDVAQSLEIPVGIVYNYRRSALLNPDNVDLEMIKAKRNQIEALKLDAEIIEIRAAIKDLQEELDDGKGDDPIESMFSQVISNIIQSKMGNSVPEMLPQTQPAAAPKPSGAATSQKLHLQDADLKELVDQVPSNIRKLAKLAPQAVIEKKILEYCPDLDDDTLKRAVPLLKT